MNLNERPLEYFVRAIDRSVKRHDIKASEDACAHLAFMLKEFIPVKALHDVTISYTNHPETGKKDNLQIRVETTPLALLRKDALETPNSSLRFSKFVRLGNRSLYIGGVFEGNIHTRYKNADYCIAMGSYGYEKAASIATNLNTLKPIVPLYLELSQQFPNLVTIVSEVVEAEVLNSEKEKIDAVVRYLRKGNNQVLTILLEQGINPIGLEDAAKDMETKDLEEIAKHLVLGARII